MSRLPPSIHEPPTAVFRLLAALSRPIVRGVFLLRVTGVEHLPRGGFVLCANHVSGFDPWALSCPPYPRQPRFLANRDEDAVATAVRHVRAGRIVLVFPEGARRRDRVLRPGSGGARIALAAGAPLVPAAVHGTEHAAPFKRWQVAFGAPVPLDGLQLLPSRIAAREATTRLWEQVKALESALAQGVANP